MEKKKKDRAPGCSPAFPHGTTARKTLCWFSRDETFQQRTTAGRHQFIASVGMLIEKFGRDSADMLMHLQKMFRVSLMMLRPCGVVVREVSVPLSENLISVTFRDVAVGLCDFLL